MLKMDLFYYFLKVNIFVYVIIRSENDELFVVNYIKIVLNFELFYVIIILIVYNICIIIIII